MMLREKEDIGIIIVGVLASSKGSLIRETPNTERQPLGSLCHMAAVSCRRERQSRW
jgi:hypothetical protein